MDPDFGTDRYASVKAEFDGFEMSFYCSTQMAARQLMVFHGDEGFIEVTCPFNSGEYGHPTVILDSRGHDQATTFRFGGVRQYRLQAEAFARKAGGSGDEVFPLEDSVRNQKFIDAVYRAAKHDGWETV